MFVKRGIGMVTLEIGMNQAGQRLDKFLGKYLPEAPSSFFYKMLRKKNITLNGKKAEGKEILQLKDQVTLWLADETILKFGGDMSTQHTIGNVSHKKQDYQSKSDNNIALYRQAYKELQDVAVIYEDTHVLVLDKPAGILTQQARAGDLSLNEWMIGYLLDTGATNSRDLRLFHPSVCNRLDRNTSGLVLCGKTLSGSQQLSELIRTHRVRKFYRTICAGQLGITGNAAEIQGYLRKDTCTNHVVISRQEPGDYIRTIYQTLEQYCTFGEKFFFTELEVELITGKPHQIRAHLSSIGHPLAGDPKYGDAHVNQLLQRKFNLHWQLLHAQRLEFPILEGVLAPLSGKILQSPLPEIYKSVLAGMKACTHRPDQTDMKT